MAVGVRRPTPFTVTGIPRIRPTRHFPVRRPVAGLRLDEVPQFIPVDAAQKQQNWRIHKGRIITRPGFKLFGSTLPLTGAPVMGGSVFIDELQLARAMAITTTKLYRYDTGLSDWVEITPDATSLNGGDTDWFEAVSWNNKYIFSQGVDTLKAYVSGAGTYGNLSSDVNLPAARHLIVFADRPIALDTLEGGTRYPWRVRWPVSGNELDWTGIGSGSQDFVDSPGRITRGSLLGSRGIIYKSDSIITVTKTGRADDPFDVDQHAIEGIGLIMPRILERIGGYDIFVGSGERVGGPGNIYAFNGSTRPIPIGDAIRQDFFDTVEPTAYDAAFPINHSQFNELWILVPGVNQATPTKALIWYYHDFLMGKSLGEWWTADLAATNGYVFKSQAFQTWNSMPGTWDSHGERWDDVVLSQDFPTPIHFDADGNAFVHDGLQSQDNGVAIQTEYISKAFGPQDWALIDQTLAPEDDSTLATLKRIKIIYESLAFNNLIVDVSTDGGKTFPIDNRKTIALAPSASGAARRAVWDKILTAVYFTVRFTTVPTGGPLSILGYDLELLVGPEEIPE